jgi:hypothetical protein
MISRYYQYDFPKSIRNFAFYNYVCSMLSMGNYQKQTFCEGDWLDKRRVSYEGLEGRGKMIRVKETLQATSSHWGLSS